MTVGTIVRFALLSDLAFVSQDIGKAIPRFLEVFLRSGGHPALYSSSQADEAPPPDWHRHVGFEECGIIAGINEGGVGEVFFRKLLR